MAPIDGIALNCAPWQSARFESLGCCLADRHIRFAASLLKGNGSFFFASLALLIFGYSTMLVPGGWSRVRLFIHSDDFWETVRGK